MDEEIPYGFPLKHVDQSLLPDQLLLSDRNRW